MGRRKKNSAGSEAIRHRAVQLVNTDGAIVQTSKRQWRVASKSSPGSCHLVRVTNKRIICDCPYHTSRNGAPCAHTVAIEILLLQQSGKVGSGPPVHLKEKKVHCPNGKDHRFKRNGRRDRKKRDSAQRYKCLEPGCGVGFSGDPGFKGKHYPPYIILMALTLFSLGISPKTISHSVILPRFKVDVPAYTIQRWGDHYTSMVERFTNSLRPNVSRLWGTDEKFQRVLGSGHWIFTVQDIATRFILSYDVSSKKTNYNARDLFMRAQERAGHAPILFKTDGLKIFRTAFRDVFGKCKGIKPLHLWSSHMRNEYSDNNTHERFNGTLGELLHGCRGLKKVDAALIKAALIHYNYVRPHQSLCGKTPAWKAGIRIEGADKWLVLIQNAAMANP